ncbi:response regulator [Candidatus Woesearchaeota archaeon]|nr:response regulator [Candidatus Woesearchaeota archaeon]
MTKIMVVEDSSLMISVLKNFIHKYDNHIEVLDAHGGQESIDIYSREKPDLVFMDIKMPGMDGLSAMEKILANDPDAKIVLCTSLKESIHQEKAIELGAKGYIMKPFTKQDIFDAIQNNLEVN